MQIVTVDSLLGLYLPDGELELGRRVNYIENPIQFRNPPDEEIANNMVFTKYLHWQYEEEIRVWANLEEKSGEHYFPAWPSARFSERFSLRCMRN